MAVVVGLVHVRVAPGEGDGRTVEGVPLAEVSGDGLRWARAGVGRANDQPLMPAYSRRAALVMDSITEEPFMSRSWRQ